MDASQVTFGILLDGFINENQLDRAAQVFATMSSGGCAMNTVLYTTLIKGATCFAPWVIQNVPITLGQLVAGKAFREVLEDMAALIQPGDVLVAHNAQFDLNTAVGVV